MVENNRSDCPAIEEREEAIVFRLLGVLNAVSPEVSDHMDACSACLRDEHTIRKLGSKSYLALRDSEGPDY